MIDIPVRRRMVGSALRRYRQELGFSLDDTARLLECDRSKISRIETGQRGIRSRELRDLLTEYGAAPQVQDVLAMIANSSAGWWNPYADVLGGTSPDYFALETIASQILIFSAQRVPGLLQTAEYATTVAAATQSVSVAESQHLSDAWRDRQESVLAGSRPEVVVIIGEMALRQFIGGSDVMLAQLEALVDASGNFPGVSIRVLPVIVAAHAIGDTNSFTILRYLPVPDIGVMYLPGIAGGAFFDDQPDVETGVAAFEHLKAYTLNPDLSIGLIKDIMGTYAGGRLVAGDARP